MCLVEQTWKARPLTPVNEDLQGLGSVHIYSLSVEKTSGGRFLDDSFGQTHRLPKDIQRGSSIQSDDSEKMRKDCLPN